MKRAVVTGGAGFIGSHLVEGLLRDGWMVAVVDSLVHGNREYVPHSVHFHQADVRDEKLTAIMQRERPDVVFHLAAQKDVQRSLREPIEDADINILGSLRVLESSQKAGARLLVFASSGGAIYQDGGALPTTEDHPARPISPYGIAKYAVDHYLRVASSSTFRAVSLRLSNVYGPRQDPNGEAGVVAVFGKKLLSGEAPTIYGGEQTRDFLFVNDAIRAFLLIANSKDAQGIFNVGTAHETSMNDLYQIIQNVCGSDIPAQYKKRKQGEINRSCLSFKKLQREHQWNPLTDLPEGIKKSLTWQQSTVK